MYDSTNLPLSKKKIIKKATGNMFIPTLFFAFFCIPFLMLFVMDHLALNTDAVPTSWRVFGPVFLIGLGLYLLVLIGVLIYEYLYYKAYYYNFTEEGAEVKKGVVSNATGHIKYDRLQNVYVDQDFLDRIFGLFDVHYETAGETSGFYSHVDGLEKASSDKLTQFLVGKMQHKTQTSVSTKSAKIKKETSATKPSGETLTRDQCKVSPLLMLSDLASLYNLIILVLTIWLIVQLPVASDAQFTGDNARTVFWFLAIGFIIYLIWKVIAAFLLYRNLYFKFDDTQGEITYKVISQSTTYLQYDRIQNIGVYQGIIDKILGLHSVSIETAGETSTTFIEGLDKSSAEKIKEFLLKKAQQHKAKL